MKAVFYAVVSNSPETIAQSCVPKFPSVCTVFPLPVLFFPFLTAAIDVVSEDTVSRPVFTGWTEEISHITVAFEVSLRPPW